MLRFENSGLHILFRYLLPLLTCLCCHLLTMFRIIFMTFDSCIFFYFCMFVLSFAEMCLLSFADKVMFVLSFADKFIFCADICKKKKKKEKRKKTISGYTSFADMFVLSFADKFMFVLSFAIFFICNIFHWQGFEIPLSCFSISCYQTFIWFNLWLKLHKKCVGTIDYCTDDSTGTLYK